MVDPKSPAVSARVVCYGIVAMSMKYRTLLLLGLALLSVACGQRTPLGESGDEHLAPGEDVALNAIDIDAELIAAAGRGDSEAVEQLLADGANIEAIDRLGRTPMIAAAYENHLAVARILIDGGADVNVLDNSKQSAYLITTSEGYLELLNLTLAAGADVHSKDSFNGTGLIRAAERGHVEIIAELLKTDIDIDHVNNLGWTALLEAIILGNGGERHAEVVRLLVEAGADVTLADGNGVTPAEHAHRRGYAEMLEILTSQLGQPHSPTVTPGPLHMFTIPELRRRQFSGGEIDIRQTMAQTDRFTQYYIAYPSDSLTITGVMHVPAGSPPFPVLILLHGYIDRESYSAGTDTWEAAEFFAGQGYLVLAPDLRSWGESDSGLSLFHMGLVIDVLNLIGAVSFLPEADADRIGLWGHSMGGGIATKVVTIDERVGAVVLYAPNSADDADLIGRWGLGCLAGQNQANDACNPAEIIPEGTAPEIVAAYQAVLTDPELIQQVAPIYHLENVTAPMQIHIGNADGQTLAATPPEWSHKLAERLTAADRDFTLFSYEGQGHFFNGEAWQQMMVRSAEFFASLL